MRRSLAGVSVPLGLWKPSPATVNRSAGRKLTLAGGRAPPPPPPPPPPPQRRDGGPVLSLSPLSPTRLRRTCAWERAGCIFSEKPPRLIAPSGVTRRKSEKPRLSQCRRRFDKWRRLLSRCSQWKSYPHSAPNTNKSTPSTEKKGPGYKLVAVRRLEIIPCCSAHYLLHLNSLYYS